MTAVLSSAAPATHTVCSGQMSRHLELCWIWETWSPGDSLAQGSCAFYIHTWPGSRYQAAGPLGVFLGLLDNRQFIWQFLSIIMTIMLPWIILETPFMTTAEHRVCRHHTVIEAGGHGAGDTLFLTLVNLGERKAGWYCLCFIWFHVNFTCKAVSISWPPQSQSCRSQGCGFQPSLHVCSQQWPARPRPRSEAAGQSAGLGQLNVVGSYSGQWKSLPYGSVCRSSLFKLFLVL